MAKRTYAAMFEPADSGGYGISFPDLPGCVSFGEDLDECMRMAHEALTLHLEGMAEDGDAFPDATPLRDLVADMNNPAGHVWASIEVEAPDSAERVNVYLPKSLLERIDRYVAERAPMNRSTFFTEAARQKLARGMGLAGAEIPNAGTGFAAAVHASVHEEAAALNMEAELAVAQRRSIESLIQMARQVQAEALALAEGAAKSARVLAAAKKG